MRPLRLLVWCVIALVVAVPAARFTWTVSDGAAHHASMKSPRSSSGGWRTATVAPVLRTIAPVLAFRRADPVPPSARLTTLAPSAPFHPPRG